MFWESVGLTSEITEDSTLEEILDDDYILQQCRERNANLCNYLAKPERISELIDLVTDQSNIVFDKNRFKRPSVAAEILSSDLPSLLDSLVSPRQPTTSSQEEGPTTTVALPFIDHLLSFIANPMPLNSLSASFFSKIMINLLLYRAAVLVPYLRSKVDFFPNLMRHLETSAICDLFIELAQQDNGQQHVIPEWFLESKLIDQLLEGLSPTAPVERHEYSSRCLVEFLSIYRNYIACNAPETLNETCITSQNSPSGNFDAEVDKIMLEGALSILDELESEKTLGSLLDLIVNGTSHSASIVVSCTDVFLACIDKAKSSTGLPPGAGDEFNENPFESLAAGLFSNNMPGRQFMNRLATKENCPLLQARSQKCEINAANAAISRLPALYALLESSLPQNYSSMLTTVGLLSPPLGKGRLSIIILISALCQLNNDQLREAICKQGLLPCFMKLFEAYPYNSFLHKAVAEMFKQLLGPVPPKVVEDGEKTPTNEDTTHSDCNLHIASTVDKLTGPNVLVRHLIQDCHVMDWILRLSCIPQSDKRSDAENEDPSAVCRLSKIKPKPGYTGYLWQIANSITTRFPSSVLFDKQYEGLPEDTTIRWEKFVAGDLAAINEVQTAKNDTETESAHEQSAFTLASLQLSAQKDMNDILKLLRGPNMPDFRSLTSGFRPAVSDDSSPIKLVSYSSAKDNNTDDGDDLCGQHQSPLASNWLTNAINFGGTDDDDDDEDEGDTFYRRQLGEEEDDEIVNVSSNSSSDEDLESPACIRQQRCTDQLLISGASILGQANGLLPLETEASGASVIKPVNTSLQPWSNDSNETSTDETTLLDPSTATSVPAAGAATSDLSSGDDSGWANFQSVSFNQDTFQQEKPLDSNVISPSTDSVKQC